MKRTFSPNTTLRWALRFQYFFVCFFEKFTPWALSRTFPQLTTLLIKLTITPLYQRRYHCGVMRDRQHRVTAYNDLIARRHFYNDSVSRLARGNTHPFSTESLVNVIPNAVKFSFHPNRRMFTSYAKSRNTMANGLQTVILAAARQILHITLCGDEAAADHA